MPVFPYHAATCGRLLPNAFTISMPAASLGSVIEGKGGASGDWADAPSTVAKTPLIRARWNRVFMVWGKY